MCRYVFIEATSQQECPVPKGVPVSAPGITDGSGSRPTLESSSDAAEDVEAL